jgi:hypothetical protein
MQIGAGRGERAEINGDNEKAGADAPIRAMTPASFE